jgi:hypothetical protein
MHNFFWKKLCIHFITYFSNIFSYKVLHQQVKRCGEQMILVGFNDGWRRARSGLDTVGRMLGGFVAHAR